ncbi:MULTISPECIES: RNA polymerase factor sigma-54 [unclassified Colwellia]|uniref:RNA polymerase factor sigma-54 n=1 Tax=unclassified Colwellia TaxID=196834 RepID=UPI0015F6678D|nr:MULTISPECIES: RNA polymerase factor sigma-54 [unclassified Colwellia]MBA6223673.1 RNA polymerase factor sigma-54 [Colwellia sp. MB3u-45]MBA6268403.1 RNA polymerase factor sigma-54 [Colwellia sp. MB3u-43]MBA6288012.1 RNA polymerase factor sigma-54 [Colwellia sp. MB3u-4]MBA6297688.1 RNA polymerase factor sigma-54 [Colwellia sp. MB02u-9]MBA6319854.1 RNA polymerase factor sigma-54 [Colwellia sp. MB02u-19]
MRPTLQLRIGQQLTMTPQLQQAIKLLQLSTLDLQLEIQEALESNPLLEVDETHDNNSESTPDHLEAGYSVTVGENSAASSDGSEDSTPSIDEISSSEGLAKTDIPEELNSDSTWDDNFSAGVSSGGVGHASEDYTYQGETKDSLQDHLIWQMELTPFTDTDRTIAIAIIEAIDEAGYLTVSAEEILESVGIDGVELDEIEVVLKRINVFDPIGVAARSIPECLRIQLNQFAKDTPWLAESKIAVSEYIDLLGNRDYRQLMRKLRLKEEQLREVIRLIQSLDPRPGDSVIKSEEQYVIPDVSVEKKNGRWTVELNPDTAPKLSVNQQYAAMSRSMKSSTDNQFIRSNLQEAKWFIKSLESRNETLLKVSNCIVQRQQGFFEHGPESMRPMVLNDIAEAVDMHESTISRVTTQKYMHTPRGIFELKYFFSSHVSTENGGECSSTAIRELIKKLVAAEVPAKPLSDSKMADILAEQGIQVARRTIAKYRESLSIPPSNQRKSLL